VIADIACDVRDETLGGRRFGSGSHGFLQEEGQLDDGDPDIGAISG
jgi:hypothetical protein